MKLIIVLLTTCLMQVSAAGFAQRLSYSKKNATLEEIFKQITLQTGYNVLYSPQKIEESKKIDVNFKNTDLKDALDQITKNQKLEYTIDSKNIIIKPEEPSFIDNIIARFQSIDVRGKVVDSLGVGIAGATVSVKNGKGSTSTSANGDFYLKSVDEGSVLVVSFMGYVTTEQAAIKEFNYVILKQSTSQLDEVLVQAYGTTTRRLSTGNITMITSKEIAQQNINNPLLALQGRVAGVEVTSLNGLPGAPVNIKIRGQYSLRGENGANDPLIVIDGVPFSNNIAGMGSIAGGSQDNFNAGEMSAFSFINPNEIESIAVLKDADATSIYGSRGSKGVVLITTKKGKTGESAVDVTVNAGWQEVTKKLDLLNTKQYLEMRKEALKNGNRLTRLENPVTYAGIYPELLVWNQNKNTDWQKELLGNSAQYIDAQASISGGTEFIQYRLGGTYHKETYVFPGESYDRKGSANMSIMGCSPNKKFRARLSATYLFNSNIVPPLDITKSAMTLAPNSPDLYASNGELNWAPNPYSAVGAGTFRSPLVELKRPLKQHISTMTANGDISYEFVTNLLFKTSFGYSKLDGNSFGIINSAASSDPANFVPSEFSRFSAFKDSNTESWSIEPQLSHNLKIGKGTLNTLIGAAIQNQKATSKEMQAYGFNSDAVMQSLSLATGYMGVKNTSSEYMYNGVFARLNYNWQEKYLINISARRDGSSRFGPSRQFGNFWSIGSAWIFTQEKMMQTLAPILSFGKIRYSYGTTGNDGIVDYGFVELYSPVTVIDNYRGIKLLKSSGLSNPYFGWESVKKMELGLDLGFFRDRVGISASVFKNHSDNLLTNSTTDFPVIVGPYENLVSNKFGLLETTGWEFLINSTNISSSAVIWNSSLNVGFMRNKELAGSDGDKTKVGLGQPYYGFAEVAVFSGVDPATGQYQFLGRNGDPTFRIDDAEITKVRTQPLFSGGISNNLKYRNLSLDLFFQFVKQNGRNYIYQFDNPPGNVSNRPKDVMDRWKSLGDQNTFQRFYTGGVNPVSDVTLTQAYTNIQNSSIAWVDASFIRLKTISLSYNLSHFAKQNLHLKNLRVFVQGQNLFIWTKYRGTDPETQNPFVLPPLRTTTAGIQLTL